MAMSADNIRGFALALSSSVFIGSSFIVKKIGLKKAGMYGVRAGCALLLNLLLVLLPCIMIFGLQISSFV